jgi:hypothetical protein
MEGAAAAAASSSSSSTNNTWEIDGERTAWNELRGGRLCTCLPN